MGTRTRAPLWYRILVIALVGWALLAAQAGVRQIMGGAAAVGAPGSYDRAVFAALPGWYLLDHAIAVAATLLGAVALFARSRHAVPLLTVALVAAMIRSGWLFAMTDILAVRGPFVLLFPLLVLAVSALALQLAHLARRRGWIA